jgi:hypothetical protein
MYLLISLSVLNKYLLLTVCKINEYMYWEYVIISIFLKTSLQESLGLVFIIILIILFCSKRNLVSIGGATPKNYTITYDRVYMSEIS